MEKYDCKNIIFSSSATVYGSPEVRTFFEFAHILYQDLLLYRSKLFQRNFIPRLSQHPKLLASKLRIHMEERNYLLSKFCLI